MVRQPGPLCAHRPQPILRRLYPDSPPANFHQKTGHPELLFQLAFRRISDSIRGFLGQNEPKWV